MQGAATHTVPPTYPRPAFTCSGCAKAYAEAAWRLLSVSERLEPRELRRLLSNCPEDLVIEVRRCGRCGKSIAAKRRALG